MGRNAEFFLNHVNKLGESGAPKITIVAYINTNIESNGPVAEVLLSSDYRNLIEQVQRLIDVSAQSCHASRGDTGYIENNPDRAWYYLDPRAEDLPLFRSYARYSGFD